MRTILCRGLLLDMDGVLVDSTPAVARVWSRWAAKFGFDADSIVLSAHGRPSLSTIRELLPHATAEFHNAENEWMEREEIADVADVIALPGSKELLGAVPDSLHAVVTSASRALAEVRLAAAGLLPLVRQMITSSDITRGKPDPEPYQKGAAKLGIAAQDCVVIEDAPSGGRAGKAAGTRVLAFRTTTPDEELFTAGADWIVNDASSILASYDPATKQITLRLRDSRNDRRTPQMR